MRQKRNAVIASRVVPIATDTHQRQAQAARLFLLAGTVVQQFTFQLAWP